MGNHICLVRIHRFIPTGEKSKLQNVATSPHSRSMKAVPKFLEPYHVQVEQVNMMRILSYLHFSLCQWQVHCSIDDAAVSLCIMTGESQPIILA